jgi:hypothetical protein
VIAFLLAAMFKLIPNPTFTCDVNLSVPGTTVPAKIRLTFRHKTSRQLAAWTAEAGAHSDDASYLDQVIESWMGVEGEGGALVAYSREALAQLLDAYPAAGAELFMAYRRQLQDARAKN